MPVTVAFVVNSARGVLQDRRSPYRYSDEDLIEYVTFGLLEAFRVRPDLLPLSSGFSAPALSLSMDDLLPLPDMYVPQLVNYVVGRAELRDDEAAEANRALSLVQAFGASLVGR